jgi:hypothetical protein
MNNKTTRQKSARQSWISVDLDGLRQILARGGKEVLAYELVQNAWDERASAVHVSLPRPQHGKTTLTVTDDSAAGFKNLADAFTLFASSYKKANPERRGAFNAGEKFVLAFCDEATILSMSGGVIFDQRGRRRTLRRTERGSMFTGSLRLSVSEWELICSAIRKLIPPVRTTLNGEEASRRKALHSFRADLPTVTADAQGQLVKRVRRTEVRIYDPFPGETPMLYEMGIPVTEIDDKWHVDIQQKVPVNLERNRISAAYLRAVRVAVLNEMASHLTAADASCAWVREAASDSRVAGDAFRHVINLRFGPKRVTYDPSDPEANRIAVSRDYTVIPSAALSAGEWANVRQHAASLPAGQVTPSPRPFSSSGKPLNLLDPEQRSLELALFEDFAKRLAFELIHRAITITFADDVGWSFGGCYGNGQLTVNIQAHGRPWFQGLPGELLERWVPFLLHELAHERVHGHLSEDYHRECCRLAGLVARLAFEKHALFHIGEAPGPVSPPHEDQAAH